MRGSCVDKYDIPGDNHFRDGRSNSYLIQWLDVFTPIRYTSSIRENFHPISQQDRKPAVALCTRQRSRGARKKDACSGRGSRMHLHSSFSRFPVRRFSSPIHGRFSRRDKHTEMTRGRCFCGKKYTTRILPLSFFLSPCVFAHLLPAPGGERNEKRTLDGHVDRST